MKISFYKLEGGTENGKASFDIATNTMTGKKTIIIMNTEDNEHMAIIEEE